MARRVRLASLAPLLLAPDDDADTARSIAEHPLAEGIRRARDVVAGRRPPVEAAGLPERVLEGLAEALAAREAWDALRALAAAPAGELARTGRLGLDRLRREGKTAPEESLAGGENPVRSPLADGIVTRVDSQGEQLVWLSLPAADGGMDIYQALFSLTAGLARLEKLEGTRKAWRENRRALLDEADLCAVAVPAAYVHLRIEEEQARAAAQGRGTPPEFADLRLVAGTPDPSAREALRARLPEPAPETFPASPEDARALAALDIVGLLAPPDEVVRRLVLALLEAGESRVVVTEQQRKEAFEAAFARALAEWATPDGIARLRDVIFEATCLSVLRGRLEDAARLRAQAERMARPGYDAATDPFLRARLERRVPLDAVAALAGARGGGESGAAEPEKKTPSGIIVP